MMKKYIFLNYLHNRNQGTNQYFGFKYLHFQCPLFSSNQFKN